MDDSNGRRAALLTLHGEESFTDTSPFRIVEEIRRLVGKVASARPLHNSALLIKTERPEQAEEFLLLDSFLGSPVAPPPRQGIVTIRWRLSRL